MISSSGAPVRTTCPYCGVGCGVIATPDGAGGAAISGDPDHRANFGKLCSKGLALGETLGLETRVLTPMMRDGRGGLAAADWDTALDAVASGFARILDRDGPDAIAFYLSGQLLTEDYYVANKLMKGFLGSGNVDTNSRLCMASSVAGHRRAFGADVVPGCYEDLDTAGLIVLVGSNAAWCHPVLFQRMLRNKRERGARIVVIDPRLTATAVDADLHLDVAPGMDSVLFSGLLSHLAACGAIDASFVANHTSGFDEALAQARKIAPDIAAIADRTGAGAEAIAAFFTLFASTSRVVTCYSQGVNQAAQGTDKVNAIINCHLATGRIGKPGMGPFSLTGQPNAMGGREVGGFANQIAAHMGFSPGERDRVARFWSAPRIAQREGLKAVDMFEAIERGKVKALWVMGTNPVVSLPRGTAMAAALRSLEVLVVSDNVASNDTIEAGAHIVLPAAAWGEKDGTVTNSERRISRQRPFLSAAGEARPDWRIVSDVAARMGFGAEFSYASAADIFREHASLSAFENGGDRAFDLSGLGPLDNAKYEALEPFQWPVKDKSYGAARLFGNGAFFTADRKARFIAVDEPRLAAAPCSRFPLVLNTGRNRDQWHTMTRTGLSARLSAHSPEPVLEMHPGDALSAGVADNGFARISTAYGSSVLPVRCTSAQNAGSVFAAIHWSEDTASFRVSGLAAPFADPFSGQPELKATPCAVSGVAFETAGFILSRRRIDPAFAAYRSRIPIGGGFLTHFASSGAPRVCAAAFREMLDESSPLAEYLDAESGVHRIGVFEGETCDTLFFAAASRNALPAIGAIEDAFGQFTYCLEDRVAILSGSPGGAGAAPGATICACFGVRSGAILAAIGDGFTDVAALGAVTRAGTNCGSCQPEIGRLIAAAATAAPPATAH